MGPLAELRHAWVLQDVATVPAGSLASWVLTALLDGRDLAPLRARYHELLKEPMDSRADNRLRRVAFMRVVADLLEETYEPRLTEADINEALEHVGRTPYLWPSFLDLAIALALRFGDRRHARSLVARRLAAPLIDDPHTLVHGLFAESSSGLDEQSLPELGYLGAGAALWMSGTAPAATLLALAAVHGEKGFAMCLQEQARKWSGACGAFEREPARWAMDRKTKMLSLTVTVRGAGSLHECAGWALDDLVYGWHQHLDRLMRCDVRMDEIRGGKTRKESLSAASKGRSEAKLFPFPGAVW